jgi:hypothetical protein
MLEFGSRRGSLIRELFAGIKLELLKHRLGIIVSNC